VNGELDTGCACDIGAHGKRTLFGLTVVGAAMALAIRRRKPGKRAA
jgi:MYXO-CTERM domain-containing protein